MKFTSFTVIAAAAFTLAAAGCQSAQPTEQPQLNAQTQTQSNGATAMGPTIKPPTPVASGTPKMPTETTIDGKKVKLNKMPDGLEYYDIKMGTGPNPKIGQTVSVQYTGTLLDGTKFDSSYDHGGQPIDFPIGVGSVIKGWDEGVPPMKVGGKRRLVIPPALGYGPEGQGPIPGNAILIFDIELVAVK